MSDLLFQTASTMALVSWLLLAIARALPALWRDRIFALTGLVVPLMLSVGYTALIMVNWADAPGGFNSLPDVMALFTVPAVALAGWVHYLAFDLFVGTWAARQGVARAVPWAAMLPVLALTFLFGPAGLLTAAALFTLYPQRTAA
jgi:hypothetical protein